MGELPTGALAMSSSSGHALMVSRYTLTVSSMKPVGSDETIPYNPALPPVYCAGSSRTRATAVRKSATKRSALREGGQLPPANVFQAIGHCVAVEPGAFPSAKCDDASVGSSDQLQPINGREGSRNLARRPHDAAGRLDVPGLPIPHHRRPRARDGAAGA
eukprot:scaffold830_cov112-Isochrysis_galbana.AAC.10